MTMNLSIAGRVIPLTEADLQSDATLLRAVARHLVAKAA